MKICYRSETGAYVQESEPKQGIFGILSQWPADIEKGPNGHGRAKINEAAVDFAFFILKKNENPQKSADDPVEHSAEDKKGIHSLRK